MIFLPSPIPHSHTCLSPYIIASKHLLFRSPLFLHRFRSSYQRCISLVVCPLMSISATIDAAELSIFICFPFIVVALIGSWSMLCLIILFTFNLNIGTRTFFYLLCFRPLYFQFILLGSNGLLYTTSPSLSTIYFLTSFHLMYWYVLHTRTSP